MYQNLFCIWFVFMGMTMSIQAQHVQGTVRDEQNRPIVGANVSLVLAESLTHTDSAGRFRLEARTSTDTLLVSFVGYVSQRIIMDRMDQPWNIRLVSDESQMQEVVVQTGYYSVPQERATGSFVQIDNELLNRSPGANILERLEGVVSGLQFVEPHATDAGGIRIRGLSTIESDTRPLIILDDFPYEGDINTINPNDVESITVLKDAAAASIWGARAGNGVIVINTKQGSFHQPTQVSFSGNVTMGDKPDLFYTQSYLPAPTVMEIHKENFERGAYTERNQTYIPSYVELLIKRRDGKISEEDFLAREASMKTADLRRDVMDYLYQNSMNQNYALNVRGGGDRYHYALSAGHDESKSYVIGNQGRRLSLKLQNTFQVFPNVELTAGISYTKSDAETNGIRHTELGLFSPGSSSSFIYDRLMNLDGTPGVTQSSYRQAYREEIGQTEGFLDWQYRPLDEIRLADNTSGSQDLHFHSTVNYRFLTDFRIQGSYRHERSSTWSRSYYDPDTYYVRNYVNRFTQADGTRIFPYNGILELGQPRTGLTHAGRMQLDYSSRWREDHVLAALAGVEARQRVVQIMPDLSLYDYNDELGTTSVRDDFVTRHPARPTGTANLPLNIGAVNVPSRITNRELSYFGNASYTYLDRYILSGSMRWDGSNLLGVKTNQRGIALWSLGTSWDINKESFYDIHWMPYLRFRATYGSAGNIDKSQSHLPTIRISTNSITNLNQALLTSGNPSLRWEQVNTVNLGLDWRMFSNRFSGSIEYYNKHAKHLLGDNMMDPTTGVGTSFKINYANLRTEGWDLTLRGKIIDGPFQWNTTLLGSYTYNRVTNYSGPSEPFLSSYFAGQVLEKGKSVDLLYAAPWYGLDSDSGLPMVLNNGQLTAYNSENFYLIYSKEDFNVIGVSVSPFFGSMHHRWSFKNFEMSLLLNYKFGHVFRRKSMSPAREFPISLADYHMDFFKRWKEPGDENLTDVPAYVNTADPLISDFYDKSDILITKGDVIRIQNISVGYSFTPQNAMRLKNIRIRLHVKNLGVLWKANTFGIDPDYIHSDFVAPKQYSLSAHLTF